MKRTLPVLLVLAAAAGILAAAGCATQQAAAPMRFEATSATVGKPLSLTQEAEMQFSIWIPD